MKKRFLPLCIFCVCLFSGCGRKQTEEQPVVYSFSGENEMFSISNGVIVSNSGEEIFYGGSLEKKDGKLSDITAFSESFYIVSDNGENILMSNTVEDMTGETISIMDETGRVSGDIISEAEIDELQDNLFFKLTMTHLNGDKDEFQMKLNLVEVTRKTDS